MKVDPSIKEQLVSILYRMDNGCHNHGCKIKKPTGQATNGPCSCSPRKWARELMDIADQLNPKIVLADLDADHHLGEPSKQASDYMKTI